MTRVFTVIWGKKCFLGAKVKLLLLESFQAKPGARFSVSCHMTDSAAAVGEKWDEREKKKVIKLYYCIKLWIITNIGFE